jgi:copper chaperone CopZ
MALQKLPGVNVEEVSVGSARLTYDPAAVRVESIVDAVNQIGFAARARD